MSSNPNVNSPAHYNVGQIEVWDAVADWKLNFDRGSAVKYIARAGRKDPSRELEDLEKAAAFLAHDIAMVRARSLGPQEEAFVDELVRETGDREPLEISEAQAMQLEPPFEIVEDGLDGARGLCEHEEPLFDCEACEVKDLETAKKLSAAADTKDLPPVAGICLCPNTTRKGRNSRLCWLMQLEVSPHLGRENRVRCPCTCHPASC